MMFVRVVFLFLYILGCSATKFLGDLNTTHTNTNTNSNTNTNTNPNTNTNSNDFAKVIQAMQANTRQLRQELDRYESRLHSLKEDSNTRLQQLETSKGVSGMGGNNGVAFFAYLHNSILTLHHGMTVINDETITNTGSHYNKTTGVFRAPVNGIYHFVFATAVPPSLQVSHLHIFLKKNGISTSYLFLDRPSQTFKTGSMSSVLQLKAGDLITVEVGTVQGEVTIYGHTFVDEENRMYTRFSGFLISAN